MSEFTEGNKVDELEPLEAEAEKLLHWFGSATPAMAPTDTALTLMLAAAMMTGVSATNKEQLKEMIREMATVFVAGAHRYYNRSHTAEQEH
jgi:hypothetical protein